MYGEGTKLGADAAARLKIISFMDALRHSGVELSFTMRGMEVKQIADDPTVITLPNLGRNVVALNHQSEIGSGSFEQDGWNSLSA